MAVWCASLLFKSRTLGEMPRRDVYVPDLEVVEEDRQRATTAPINASSDACFVRVRPNIKYPGTG